MCDKIFSEDEIRLFSEGQVPKIHRGLVTRALNATSPTEVEEIGLLMAGEKLNHGFIILMGRPAGTRQSIWVRVLGEVHDFLCTDSETYQKERSAGTGVLEQGVTVIATTLGASVNVGTGLFTGLVTVAFVLASKMGRNAWCKWAADNLGTNDSSA